MGRVDCGDWRAEISVDCLFVADNVDGWSPFFCEETEKVVNGDTMEYFSARRIISGLAKSSRDLFPRIAALSAYSLCHKEFCCVSNVSQIHSRFSRRTC